MSGEGYVRKSYHRKAYTRKDGTRVPASDVKSSFVHHVYSTKPKIIPMADDRHLRKLGYSLKKDAHTRHIALEKSAAKHGYSFTVKRVNALGTLFKTTHPELSKKARSDVKYLQKYRGELGSLTTLRKY